MAKKLTKLSDLQPAPYNPREISDEALGGLKASLARFGDISGLVWNSRTGHLVAGHQRLRALQEQYEDNLQFDAGCVVAPDGERFAVRVVDWDETTEKAANIAANSQYLAGAFTADLQGILESIEDIPDFNELRFDSLFQVNSDPPAPPDDFQEYDETIATEHTCPKCGYKWSGGQ